MSNSPNAYLLTKTSGRFNTSEQRRSEKTFRWQVVPATFTYFVALYMLTIALLSGYGWIEYLQSDRHNANRSLYWSIMESSLIPISAVASLMAFYAAWAWTRRPARTAFKLVFVSIIVFVFGFIMRM